MRRTRNSFPPPPDVGVRSRDTCLPRGESSGCREIRLHTRRIPTMTLKDISPSKDVTGMLGDVLDPSLGLKHSQWGRHKLRNGRIIDVEISSYTMAYPKSNDHKVAYVIVQDINERKKTEHQTRRSATGHRSLLETIQEGFAYCRMLFENHRPVISITSKRNKYCHQGTSLSERREGKRAAELVIANKELLFQNEEKEKRAAELVIANKELLFQNEEKGKTGGRISHCQQGTSLSERREGKTGGRISHCQQGTSLSE
jgi:PAS domain-containing protein